MPSGKRKIRQTQGNKSPKTGLTPESKRLNLASDNTMAAWRPQIIRMSNDDLIKDKCALTELLEHQCHDKTHTIGVYHYEPLKCHREGLKEYRDHRETC